MVAGALVLIPMAFIPAGPAPIDFSAWVGSAVGLIADGDDKLYPQTRWFELAPAGWDPYAQVRELRQQGTSLLDSDKRALQLMKKTREIFDNAPINPVMEGARVRIPGYVVPLDQNERGTSEFLLVPYFGACIHTPAPPSNQIIHVRFERRQRGLRTMDNVWVAGVLKTARSDTSMGRSSYAMEGRSIKPYVPPAR